MTDADIVVYWFILPLAAALVVIAAYDLYAYLTDRDNTVSRAVGRIGLAHPAVRYGFLVGSLTLVIGLYAHFFGVP